MSAETSAEQKAAQLAAAPKAAMNFIPANVDEAFRMAKMLGESGLLPDTLKGKPNDILVILMTGAELGISPMAAIREVYVVKGKAYLSALLKVGLVKNHSACEYFRLVESTAKKATFVTKRRGEDETRLTFTIEEAGLAGLTGDKGGNWSKYPALMLRRRCSSQLVDEVYPDIVRGAAEESDMPESAPWSGTTAPNAPAAVRVESRPNRAPAGPPPEEAELVDPTGESEAEEPPTAQQAQGNGEKPVGTEADAQVELQLEALFAVAKGKSDMLKAIPLLNALSTDALKNFWRQRYNARLAEVSR